MDSLNAKPNLLKQSNLSFIRNVIKAKCTATRAEIANETNISSTTVRSLLSEMMQNGEIESIGYDESSGGRKAERYRLCQDRYHGAAFCIADNQIHSLLVNVCGDISEVIRLEAPDGNFEPAIVSFLDNLIKQKEIKSIGIGVPGVIEGESYWKKSEHDDKLYKSDIGNTLAQRYKIPIIIENNLNATAIGFERRYKKISECKESENTNMVYLHFANSCISAGIIAGGRLIRGFNNFAGELGLIPEGIDKLLDECMSESIDDTQYVNLVVKIIGWLCGILNPQYVVLSGPDARKYCNDSVSDMLSCLLPKHMLAQILYSPDVWNDYYNGMAYLTAGKMFDEIQFIKEPPCF